MRKTVLISAILMAFISGCQKEIVIPQPPYDSKPSIQALIEPDSLPKIFFNKTVPYFSKTTITSDLLYRGAIVKIIYSGFTDVLSLDSIYNKITCNYLYYYKGTKPILWDTDYILEITNGAEVYTATTKTSITPCTIDSVGYTPTFKDIYGEHEGVIVYFKDLPSQTNYYRYEMAWRVDASMTFGSIILSGSGSCLGADTVSAIETGRSVYNDVGLDGKQIKVVIEPAYSHFNGLKTYVNIQTIDKAAFDFFDQLDKQKQGQFNPFVEPTFIKEGQFGKRAIGFFGCKTHSVKVPFVFPE